MSAVHAEIAEAAWHVLSADAQEEILPHLQALLRSSEYPDVFAGGAVPAEKKALIDPDADRFLWPSPPAEPWYDKVLQLTVKESGLGIAPLRMGAYMPEHYLRHSLAELLAGETCAAVKYMGVYSHVIGDTGEPIHAVHPEIVDLVLPPPSEHLAMELHATVENLRAPVNIQGYQPRVLGRSIEQASMAALAGLYRSRDVGAALVVPIVQSLYGGDRPQALSLSSVAQNESARHFADFMHTVFWLREHGESTVAGELDLRDYPPAAADVDMLYRYRPAKDVSLVPYSGKSVPLAFPAADGGVEHVKGLGVLPFLGPPHVPCTQRTTRIDYLLLPGAFFSFHARIGVNPMFQDSAGGVVFRVLTDEIEQFCSESLTTRNMPVSVEVPLGQARWLTLATRYEPNATYDEVMQASELIGWALHAVWGEPRLA